MFVLEDGATLSNVIIGPNQAEGVHCQGTWYTRHTTHGKLPNQANLDTALSTTCGGQMSARMLCKFLGHPIPGPPQPHSSDTSTPSTLKQGSGTSYVNGGGAFKASDKIIQFNGFGTVSVQSFYASDYGKVVRSCGNCSGNGGARHIIINGAVAHDGGVLCGINTNYGDTCGITNSCQDDGKSCARYTGNNDGDEPTEIGEGADGTYCTVSGLSTSC